MILGPAHRELTDVANQKPCENLRATFTPNADGGAAPRAALHATTTPPRTVLANCGEHPQKFLCRMH